MIDSISALPTPVAQMARRLRAVGAKESGDTFLMASNLFEVSLKTIDLALYASLRDQSKEHAYHLGYKMIRGDGLGTWEEVLRSATSPPEAGFHSPPFYPLLAWATKNRTEKDDEWFFRCVQELEHIYASLGVSSTIPSSKPKILHLISALVQLRNKTKAHGAVGPDFFSEANEPYTNVLTAFIDHCPALQWSWWHIRQLSDETRRGLLLSGMSPSPRHQEVADVILWEPGVHVWPNESQHPYSCSRLLFADQECREFLYPNGGYTDAGTAEFIDYYNSTTSRIEVPHFKRPPATLPPSTTQGQNNLEVHTNVFGNLPRIPHKYVQRRSLEAELTKRLKDDNHHIVTLHGRGGIGKTSLALWVARSLAQEEPPHFDAIVWFSARDLDLRPTGPTAVQPAVVELEDVSRFYGELFDVDQGLDDFAKELRQPKEPDGRGHLFIFDNFETMKNTRDIHAFLDTHTHLPNKVLITSRERAFKADFPIEVKGMEPEEAEELLRTLARDLSIEGLVTDDVIEKLCEHSDRHPYVLRIMAGEMAKEGRYIPPKTMLPQRRDIMGAVFERSFNRLSNAGRRVFLTLANWQSAIAEVALFVVLGRRGLPVDEGIEECERLSLINRHFLADDSYAYSVPQLARVFGQKKLKGDPDRLVIEEDLDIIRRFGVIPVGRPVQSMADEKIREFTSWAQNNLKQADEEEQEQILSILENLAESWPQGWIELALAKEIIGASQEEVAYCFRRAVEENPSDERAWIERARYAKRTGDESTWVDSEIRAVELAPEDINLLMRAAQDLNQYISDHKEEIPEARRGVYLASVRARMEAVSDRLSATGLSRLAWLFLHEGDQEKAFKYAARGLKRNPTNDHCRKICERAQAEGWADEELLES